MKNLLLASSLFSLTAFGAMAQESFTSELGASFVNFDDLNIYSVSGSYYFTPVTTNKGPLAEAVFLSRVNSVTGSFTRSEINLDFGNGETIDGHINTWNLGGTYHFDNTGLFLGANVSHINGSGDALYGFTGGYYLSDDWTLTINTGFDENLDYVGVGVSTKKLFDLGADRFLTIGASYGNPDEGDSSYQVMADYYLNARLSVGLSHDWADSFDDGATSVNATWFVTDRLSLSGQISDVDTPTGSETVYAAAISTRF